MSFTYENQGNNTYLVYKIGASDNVDTMSLGMITNNKIDGIVPTLFTQSDTDRFIKYNISAKVSAKEFLSGVVNKKRLLGVFISVLKAIKSTEEYMIDARSLLIDLEHIYVDVSKCDAMLVCLPLVRQNESVNIPMFFKQIMFSTQFDQNENCDYVAQIINYLNSTPVFSVDAFEKLLMDIDADNLNIAASKAVVGQQKPVQPQSQSQSQQPKPMQPAMNQLKNAQVQTNMPSQGKMQSQRETQSANNVVQPNQVNFAVPNMNPQNQNRINNNVQMGTNISGTYVETTSEKQMSMFGLLTHYSKENKQIYERQKAQRKAQKEAEKNGAAMPGQNVKASNASFAIPGQPPQQRPQPQTVMPQQPQQQFAQPQRQFTQSNQPQSQFAPIIYRDMKPANIMLKPDGNITLIDFGTAREFKEKNLADTTCLGTMGYAAPEQFGGMGQTDGRTDIYCLGATLYHLVTGKNPCEPPYEIRPIREINPSLSGGLERIILKCTQPNPANRYQNAAELMYALEHYDEIDDIYRKKQKRKLAAFITTSVITVILGATSIWGYVSAENKKSENYDNILKTADTYEDYYNAIITDPTRTDAYLKLNDMLTSDFVLDKDEANILTKIQVGLDRKNSDGYSQTYDVLSDLKKKNPDGYQEVCYQYGESFLFYYDINVEKDRYANATKWYKDAVQKYPVAQIYCDISDCLDLISQYGGAKVKQTENHTV